MTMCLSLNSYDHGFLSGLPAKSADTKRQQDKFVIFIFSDGLKTQYTNAKPILDKYGFKGTFDVICNYVGKKEGYMNWKEIKTLNKEGHEIGSHSMNHVHLKQLSKKSIEYEVGNSKKCLNAHGIKVTSFEYPFSEGSDDKTIVSIVAKYYDFATRGNDPLMFLRCDGMMKYGQKDCRTLTDNGTPTHANKYAIRNWSHDFEKVQNSYSDAQALRKFINVVESQSKYNKDGIKAIPIIMYHGIGENKNDSATDIDLFEKEMKYLHDKKFKVITISDFGYNKKNNYLFVKDIKRIEEPTANVTSNVTTPAPAPTANVTSNVTTPAPAPTANVTSNVTTPAPAPEENPILEILKKLFGLGK
jgi:peptidoglycan/xylan/chitin deacetylase (PgdA/CDA1 family)